MNEFKWVFKLSDGEVIELPQLSVQRTIDRRGTWENPQVVYEVTTLGGVIRRLWPEDIASMDQVAL